MILVEDIITQYPNNKPGNQLKNKQIKGEDPKSEDKDNTTIDTVGAYDEDSTTTKDTTAPSGEASLGAYVSETSQATSPPPRTMNLILGAHPIDDHFWENTNPTDVSIDTVNSEEKMTGSHITKFHTPKDEEIIPDDLLSQVNQHFDNQPNHKTILPSLPLCRHQWCCLISIYF